MNHAEFAGRVAVVTGGSEGLGFDLCRSLCAASCTVYFCGRNRATGEAAARELGTGAIYIQADMALPEEIRAFAATVQQQAGQVDYLVNNVAYDARNLADEISDEACDHFWQVNLRSYLLTTRAFLELVRAGAGKSIVNVGTTNYMIGLEPFTMYATTKSGILGFTRALARELGREGIRVNQVSPGWIMTPKQLREHATQADQDDLIRDQALKFLLTPEHVSTATMFMLSDAAAGVTGQNLVVDGGKHMA